MLRNQSIFQRALSSNVILIVKESKKCPKQVHVHVNCNTYTPIGHSICQRSPRRAPEPSLAAQTPDPWKPVYAGVRKAGVPPDEVFSFSPFSEHASFLYALCLCALWSLFFCFFGIRVCVCEFEIEFVFLCLCLCYLYLCLSLSWLHEQFANMRNVDQPRDHPGR